MLGYSLFNLFPSMHSNEKLGLSIHPMAHNRINKAATRSRVIGYLTASWKMGIWFLYGPDFGQSG